MKTQEDKSREYINIVKGLAIFLMLWGHCIQYLAQGSFDFFENSVFKFIYSFHMPLFMIISGYLFYFSFQKRGMKDLIVHRSKPLLWTIVFCSAFNYIITSGVMGLYSKHVMHLFNGAVLSNYGSLWFLWSVLSSSIGIAIICKKTNKIWLQIFLLCLWTIIVYAFPCGELNVFMYPYFVIGFYFAQFKNLRGGGNKILAFIVKIMSIIIFIVMLVFYEKKYYIYTTGLYNSNYSFGEIVWIDVYRWAIGLFGCIAILSVVEILYNIINKKTEKQLPLSLGLSKVGGKSLQIYALSVSLLSYWLPKVYSKIISIVGYNFLVGNIYVYNFVITPLFAVVYCIGIYWLVKLFEKIKFSKVLFGK